MAFTYVEVVARLEKVVKLDNVRVASRDFLENVDLVADLELDPRALGSDR